MRYVGISVIEASTIREHAFRDNQLNPHNLLLLRFQISVILTISSNFYLISFLRCCTYSVTAHCKCKIKPRLRNIEDKGHLSSASVLPLSVSFQPRTSPLYKSPISKPQSGQQISNTVKRLIEILLKAKKRNPVFVGDFELESVVRELWQRIERIE
ncbi:hypothetical protein NE237_001621 [Protea cynaroides]|uniref:Uncharacterized protein n=1 Tax=Protea cynaroides TaxID=273540 RepID=A0A9Q0QYM6_9MAGN|nr:hypothetical protein NE237_001621 [Protea cynaroides]